MSIEIRDTSCRERMKKSKPCWNDMDEMKYLICAIDNYRYPRVSPPPSRSIILPPRVKEIPCEIPPRRPPCVPPPRCCPITPGPCCPRLLPPPILLATLPQPPLTLNPYCGPCHPCSPLPCYRKKDGGNV